MAPNAFATGGSLSSTSAVMTVAASPTAICRNDTARRFSPSAQAIASNASTPNADCTCSMIPKPPRAIMPAGLASAMPGSHSGRAIDKRRGVSHRSIMPSIPSVVGAGDLLKHKSFLLFLLSRSFSRFATQIGAVAIGWQVYDMTGSAFQLGMIGLVQFLPTALLLFVAGHAADRYERKRVVQICEIVEGLTALFLALGAFGGWLTVTQIFIATFVLGIIGAF